MPTYNRAHMIGQAIDAILQQTYHRLELIVVNDGSKDNTPELLRGYVRRDPRVRVINKENQGIPLTVNRGWRESIGEYLTWTSDDNIYDPTAIEVMAGHLESHRDTMMVYTDCRYIDADGNTLGYPAGRDAYHLETECVIAGCLLFRRRVLEEVEMFRPDWMRCHDYDFYRRVYKRFKIERIPEVLYSYRFHQASMSGDVFAITTEHARLLSSYGADGPGTRMAWAWCWNEIARQAHRDGQMWRAVWYWLKASFQERNRFPTFWRALWTTLYSYVPMPIQRLWRAVKRQVKTIA
jgi:glycosyltransferase involved in cell wall biosynthesis